jgi:hypothetical protein
MLSTDRLPRKAFAALERLAWDEEGILYHTNRGGP